MLQWEEPVTNINTAHKFIVPLDDRSSPEFQFRFFFFWFHFSTSPTGSMPTKLEQTERGWLSSNHCATNNLEILLNILVRPRLFLQQLHFSEQVISCPMDAIAYNNNVLII